SRNAHDLIDGAVQCVAIIGIDTAGTDRRSVESDRCSYALHERYYWRHIRSARLPALVVMFIKPHIGSHSEQMRTGYDTEIVQELRRSDGAKSPWRVDIRQNYVVKAVASSADRSTTIKWQHVRKRGVCFTLGKQEHKTREANREFIHNAGRDRLAI